MELVIDSVSSFSFIGPREENEDCHTVKVCKKCTVLAVCDGMGGYDGGAESSRIAVESLMESFALRGSRTFTITGMQCVYKEASRRISDMGVPGAGTTMVAAIFNGRYITVVSTGDSRAYIFRNMREVHITHDDSLVQNLVDKNEITREEARMHPQRNIITRCITAKAAMSGIPEISRWYPRSGDFLLLCSDGVWEALPADTLSRVFKNKISAEAAAIELAALLETSATDNYTAVIVKFGRLSFFNLLWNIFSKPFKSLT